MFLLFRVNIVFIGAPARQCGLKRNFLFLNAQCLIDLVSVTCLVNCALISALWRFLFFSVHVDYPVLSKTVVAAKLGLKSIFKFDL